MTAPTRTPAPLPPLLRLPPHRSMVRLGTGSRLLGLDPAAAIAVDGLSPPLAQMLDELVGPVPTEQLLARAVGRGADRSEAALLLGELLDAGALVDAAGVERRQRRRADGTVVVHGGGPLGVGVVLGLAAAGVGAVHVVTSGAVSADDVGTGLGEADRGRDRADAIVAALARLRPGTRTGPPPQRAVPDLVVLADTSVPDPVQVARLHETCTTHLAVRVRDGVGVVGPLVLPGRSACLGCLEVERCSRDPVWTSAAAQLTGSAGGAGSAGLSATAALATAQVLVALDGPGGGRRPAALEATLELDVEAGTLVRRTWRVHPRCRCGADPGVGGTTSW